MPVWRAAKARTYAQTNTRLLPVRHLCARMRMPACKPDSAGKLAGTRAGNPSKLAGTRAGNPRDAWACEGHPLSGSGLPEGTACWRRGDTAPSKQLPQLLPRLPSSRLLPHPPWRDHGRGPLGTHVYVSWDLGGSFWGRKLGRGGGFWEENGFWLKLGFGRKSGHVRKWVLGCKCVSGQCGFLKEGKKGFGRRIGFWGK